jgi:hypothetical protein
MTWQPSAPFATPAVILKTTQTKVNGVVKRVRAEGPRVNVTARSFGGTERDEDGIISAVSTMVFQTWYTPEIRAGDAIRLLEDGSEWEVIGDPEDISMRHQWLQFKGKRIQGGA